MPPVFCSDTTFDASVNPVVYKGWWLHNLDNTGKVLFYNGMAGLAGSKKAGGLPGSKETGAVWRSQAQMGTKHAAGTTAYDVGQASDVQNPEK